MSKQRGKRRQHGAHLRGWSKHKRESLAGDPPVYSPVAISKLDKAEFRSSKKRGLRWCWSTPDAPSMCGVVKATCKIVAGCSSYIVTACCRRHFVPRTPF